MSALTGIRVLDFTRVVSGPYCTMLLSDLGAEVIKVERPGSGDDSRAFGPPFVQGESTYFLSLNRGKKSVVIDLATRYGRQIARRLARRCDVVVENYRIGYMGSVGLDYDTLSSDNDRLVYCSMTAFGESGPYKNRAGYDVMVSALGGMMGITGHPGGPPVKTGFALLDVATGVHAATAICAALYERERSGKGQRLELSLLGVQLSTLINAASAYTVAGEVIGPQGNAHVSIVPYGAFRAADGYIVIGAANDPMFMRLCDALGLPELARDRRFRTNADRVAHRHEIEGVVGDRLAGATVSEWVDRIGAAGVAVAPVNTIQEVFSDPQVVASGQVSEFDHSTLGEIRLVGSPIHMGRTPIHHQGGPPVLGQHTEAVLAELDRTRPCVLAWCLCDLTRLVARRVLHLTRAADLLGQGPTRPPCGVRKCRHAGGRPYCYLLRSPPRRVLRSSRPHSGVIGSPREICGRRLRVGHIYSSDS